VARRILKAAAGRAGRRPAQARQYQGEQVMAEPARDDRWTVSDLERLPDDEWHRYEIIDGELFVSPPPHYKHQECGMLVAHALTNWNFQTGLGEVLPAVGLIFTEHDSVIPDIVWISHERLALLVDDAGHFQGAPELVVEVLSAGSSNERRDRDVKLRLYSAQGVREYWMVDWRAETVAVYRRQRARLRLHATLTREDTLTSPLLPGFSLAIARLFD
jgi:Uma2 family endonuclease